eukprot:TRINITY_DN1746_c0_g3_i2.p1 TRINITY_DN1746_c0_g3~~TRINITY_DN1746_c0_g3_i2.p1  ORF type:complete len:149 (-),score=31.52 TRINITY_DN1746_c0_g3_i2:244-690(-)
MITESEDELIGAHKQPEEIANKYSIDTWYQHIRNFTFETEFIELQKEEALAIKSEIGSLRIGSTHIPTKEEKELILSVQNKIDAVIQKKFGGKAFVKLSIRSPKDAVYEVMNSRVKNILDCKLKELQQRGGITENDELIAFFQVATKP